MRSSRRFLFRRKERREVGALAVGCALAGLLTAACVTTNEVAKPAPNDPEFRDRLDGVARIYETRDVQKILEMYDQDTYTLSFDQTHAFDTDATSHRATLDRLLGNVAGLKVAWDPDVTVDRTSKRVWTTRRFKATAKMKAGDERVITGWHSAIWEDRQGKWLMAYEHFRADTQLAALPPPPPPPPAAEPSPEAIEAAARDSIRDVFFDYDLWNIRPDQVASIGVVLDYLDKYPTTEMTIEGHCDERGSTRYNIRLGEKRAAEAKAWLVSKGVAPERLRTISFGKSRPFEEGRSEDAWQSNRRAHFVVTKAPQRP